MQAMHDESTISRGCNEVNFFFFFAGGVAMVLQHRYFIQETVSTGTICSHGYGFDIYALITAFRK